LDGTQSYYYFSSDFWVKFGFKSTFETEAKVADSS
jgi:hypothetical protein